MAEAHDQLTPDVVRPLLRGRFGTPYRWSPECASTQDVLRDGELPEGAVAVTEHQTGGRGRSGRAWEDVAGRSLLASCLLRPAAGAPAEQLSLVTGLAVAEAIDRLAGVRSELKWPNDVLVGEAKVAGILLESSRGGVVCGVGVNVDHVATELPDGTRLRPTSLRAVTGRRHDRAALLAELLLALERHYDTWAAAGLAPLLPALEARNALRGARVAIGGVAGVVGPIAPDGRLSLTRDDGSAVLVASGEAQVLGST